MPKKKNLITRAIAKGEDETLVSSPKAAEPLVQKTNIKKRKKKKPEIEFKSIRKFLVLIIILLAIFLVLESTQIFLQFKDFKKETIVQRPVYMVEGQPIDIDAYLREYFANTIPKKTMQVTVSAYSSTKDQTDGDPYLTAIGTPVRDGIIAANFLPIGTVVRFPDQFGEKIFVVEDRMHEKYGLQVDIWMSNQEEAKKFGIQYLKMEIF
ncbi:MAG: hypothetical protein ABIJ84_01620 [bacterium]